MATAAFPSLLDTTNVDPASPSFCAAEAAVRAQTILAQLGGRRFLAMTGARDLLFDATGHRFRLPARFARHGITHIQVLLDSSDTYTLRARRMVRRRGALPELTVVDERADVYADVLCRIFTDMTGLATSL